MIEYFLIGVVTMCLMNAITVSAGGSASFGESVATICLWPVVLIWWLVILIAYMYISAKSRI